VTTPAPEIRSYGCTFGCGNPYDIIVVTVLDGSTELLCIPCFIKMAYDMTEAITNPDSDVARNAASVLAGLGDAQVPGPTAKRGRKNAPATSTDPGMFEAYEEITALDEMPEEFHP